MCRYVLLVMFNAQNFRYKKTVSDIELYIVVYCVSENLMDEHELLYMDEAGFNLPKTRGRGRNVIGHRASTSVPGQWGGIGIGSSPTMQFWDPTMQISGLNLLIQDCHRIQSKGAGVVHCCLEQWFIPLGCCGPELVPWAPWIWSLTPSSMLPLPEASRVFFGDVGSWPGVSRVSLSHTEAGSVQEWIRLTRGFLQQCLVSEDSLWCGWNLMAGSRQMERWLVTSYSTFYLES